MKIYHSYWSKGYQGSPSAYLVDLHNLSAHLAKKQYGEVHLITDSEGKKQLQDIEYTSISTVLDEIPNKYSPVWSLGKIFAYNYISKLGKPFAHIDYDVLLWKPFPEELILSEIFAERIEIGVELFYNLEDFYNRCPNKHDLKTLQKNEAINAGTFGGNNLKFIEEMTDKILNFVFDPNNEKYMTSLDANLNLLTWSRATIAEQLYIQQYCLLKNKKINVLMKETNRGLQEIECSKLGYTHLWGDKNKIEVKTKIYENLKKFELTPKEQYDPNIKWAIKGFSKALKAFGMKETDQSKSRLAVCMGCDKWTGTSCKVCGCYVKLKVKIPEEKCPEGKW